LLVVSALVALSSALAPVHNLDAPNAIPNKYLVALREDATVEMRDLHVDSLKQRLAVRAQNEQVLSTFHVGNLIGYAAYYTKEMLEEERSNPLIRLIENDQVVTLLDEEQVEDDDTTETQVDPTWGIDRIDQRALPLSKTYTYWGSAGSDVVAYIIDTGIYVEHNDFGGRASWGFNAIPNEGPTDGNGHGTHVASTVGGKIYGVAKNVTLVAIKVLSAGGSGSWEGVIQGIQWATNDHIRRGKAHSVANMSLGGGISTIVDQAVTQSIIAGVNHAIAAGNSNADACNYSPARVPGSLSTGATTNTDGRASFSNYGNCVVVFAPGNAITAAWIGGVNNINTISGTSMAAPHVAGIVAVHLGHNPDIHETPITVGSWLIGQATIGIVTNPGNNSPNRLVFSPFTEIVA